jgi:hypothetical protein
MYVLNTQRPNVYELLRKMRMLSEMNVKYKSKIPLFSRCFLSLF